MTPNEMLLRWVEGLSGRRLAALMGVSPAAVSQWKTGARPIRPDVAEAIDAALDADGKFARLIWLATTANAHPAAVLWDFNCDRQGPWPLTVWIRPEYPGPLAISAHWGVLELLIEFEHVAADGVFIEVPVQFKNPPIRIELSQPGWVGHHGGSANGDLGVPVHHALPIVNLVRRGEPGAPRLSKHFRRMLRRPVPADDLTSEFGLTTPIFHDILRTKPSAPTSTIVRDQIARPLHANLDKLGVTRRARLLTVAEAARRLSSMLADSDEPALPRVTDWETKLTRLEKQTTPPNRGDALIIAALDVIYDCSGSTMSVPTRQGTGPRSYTFPRWWTGPIWIRTDRPCDLTITWGPWKREVRFTQPGQVVWTRCAPEGVGPMHLSMLPPQTEWVAGLGQYPGATDINHDWAPATTEDERWLIDLLETTVVWLFRTSRPAALRLVRFGSHRG